MNTRPTWQSTALLAASLLFAVLLVAFDWRGIIDDAYIFLRYAHNIANGTGYVFNPGEYVEGATSTSWTLLLAGMARLGLPLVTALRLLSLGTLLGTLALIWRYFHQQGLPLAAALLALVLLAAERNFGPGIMMGLETGLFALLLVWFSMLAGKLPVNIPKPQLYLLGLTGVLLFLTRPESLLLLGLVGMGLVFSGRARQTWPALAFWAAGLLVVTMWRLAVFGDYIPNSARDKSVVEFILQRPEILWPRLQAGLTYLSRWVQAAWPLVGLGLAGWLVCLRRSWWAGYVWGAALLAQVVTVLYNSGDWMPLFRLLAPAAAVLALLSGEALQALHDRLRKPWQARFSILLALAALLVAGAAFAALPRRGFLVVERWPTETCYVQAGQALRPVLPAGAVLAPEALGALGYELPEFRFFDTFGLIEPYIARNGTIPLAAYSLGKHHYQYTMQQAPDVFFFHSNIGNHIPLLNRWGYSEQYQTYQLNGEGCSLVVGVKNSLVERLRPALASRFQIETVETRTLVEIPGDWPMGLK